MENRRSAVPKLGWMLAVLALACGPADLGAPQEGPVELKPTPEEFFQAIEQSNPQKVEQALEAGMDPQMQYGGRTTFEVAVAALEAAPRNRGAQQLEVLRLLMVAAGLKESPIPVNHILKRGSQPTQPLETSLPERDPSPRRDFPVERSPFGRSERRDDPVLVGGNVLPPVQITDSEPEYTMIARKAQIQGDVVVQVVIDRQGRVTEARVLRGLPMGLDEKAIEAVKTWRFKPATLHGRSVTAYYNVTVEFRLD